MITVRVQPGGFDPGGLLETLESSGAGAVASFTGIVRADDGIFELVLEYYPGMTERMLQALAEVAAARWTLLGVTLVHRTGVLGVGERIVFVGTAAAHRAAALEACTYLIDRLKTDAPFWKQERGPDGARWVEARASDGDAAARWSA